jgi:hypothetical protein
VTTAVEVDPERPVLVDKYLDRATELDVDALVDKEGGWRRWRGAVVLVMWAAGVMHVLAGGTCGCMCACPAG